MVIFVLFLICIILFILWVLSLCCRKGHPALKTMKGFRYAHRGLHNAEQGVPENSMMAFRRAAARGYGVELDVHLTKDGRLAVIHDDSLLRTAGADVKVSELTAKELGQYRLEGTKEKIPFLEEVLPLFVGVAPLIVELKVEKNADALAAAACEMLDKFDVVYAIESFHPQAIKWLKKNRPELCRGQLSQNFMLKGKGTGMGKLADFAMTHCMTSFLTFPDFIAYNHEHRNCLALKIAKGLWGVQEVSWTIRDPEWMEVCEAGDALIIFEQFEP